MFIISYLLPNLLNQNLIETDEEIDNQILTMSVKININQLKLMKPPNKCEKATRVTYQLQLQLYIPIMSHYDWLQN